MRTSELKSQQPKIVTTVIGLDKTRLLDHETFTLGHILEIIDSKGLKKENAGKKYEAHIYSDSIRFELAENELKLPDLDFTNIVQFVTLTDYPGVCFILSKKRSQGQYIIIRFDNLKQMAEFKKLVQVSNSRVLFDEAEPLLRRKEANGVNTSSESSRDSRQSHSPSLQAKKPIVLQKAPTKGSSHPINIPPEVAFRTTFTSNCCCEERQSPDKHACTQISEFTHNSRSQNVHKSHCLQHSPNAKANGTSDGPTDCQSGKATTVAAVQTDNECQCGHRHKSSGRTANKIPPPVKPQTIKVILPHSSKMTQTKSKCVCENSKNAHTRRIQHSRSTSHPCQCSKSRRLPNKVKLPVNFERGEFSSSSDSSSELSFRLYCAHADLKPVSRTWMQKDKLPQLCRYSVVQSSARRPCRIGDY